MKPLRLAVGIPAYGCKVDFQQIGMWMSLGAALAQNTDKFEMGPIMPVHICPVDHARNTLVYDALQAKCDWLFMVDADVFHSTLDGADGADILQMVYTGYKQAAAVIASPIFRRRIGEQRLVVRKAILTDDFSIVPPAEYHDQVVECDRIPTAFMAVSLQWIRAQWPHPPWFVTRSGADEIGRPFIYAEDYSFCDGVRQRGGKILCDARFYPSHAVGRAVLRAGTNGLSEFI